jgi:high-affinity iron transporter
VVVAVVLVAAVQLPSAPQPAVAPIATASNSAAGHAHYTAPTHKLTTTVLGTTTTYSVDHTVSDTHDGIDAQLFQTRDSRGVSGQPTSITLDQLVALSGGRLPIGMNASQNPGPFAASWHAQSATEAWFVGPTLIDAQSRTITTVQLTGGGLTSSRTLTAASTPAGSSWNVRDSYTSRTIAGITNATTQRAELLLWKLYVPILLVLAALILALYALRATLRTRRRARVPEPQVDPALPRVAANV